jgi:hypothetical protein
MNMTASCSKPALWGSTNSCWCSILLGGRSGIPSILVPYRLYVSCIVACVSIVESSRKAEFAVVIVYWNATGY